MASSMIHIAVAKEINKTLKKDESKLLIGTIAPDISKLVGESKTASHFLGIKGDIPNLDKFLSKYKNYLYDDFVLGYYIHLITDYLWFKYFITEFLDSNSITKLDGTIVHCSEQEAYKYIYNDYTNMNVQLIDEYNLDLKIFYSAIPEFDNIIKEIPMNKLNVIIEKTGLIIENSRIHKDMVFNIQNIKKFISFSVDIILSNLKDLL